MNIHHVLFFCFISALCGDVGLVSAKIHIFTGAEGGNGSISCFMSHPKNVKFFCKEECKADGILVRTENVTAQNGRFSTHYQEHLGMGVLTVTFTNLIMSDAARYKTGLGTGLVPDIYCYFEIRVSDELPFGNSSFVNTDIEGENITLPCPHSVYRKQKFLCRDNCTTLEDIMIETDGNITHSGRFSLDYTEGSVFGLHVIVTNARKSDTGWYKCGYGRAVSPVSSRRFPFLVVGDPSASTTTQSVTSPSVFTTNQGTDPPASWTTQSVTSPSVFPVTSYQGTASDSSASSTLSRPLVACVIIIILLAAFILLLVLYGLKKKRSSQGMTLENRHPGSTGVKTIHENVVPGR